MVVYEYFWEDHAKQPQISCRGVHTQDENVKFAGNSRDVTIHVMIYTVHLGGFQELYRHFLRLPSGAIVEVSTSTLVSYNEILIEKKCLQRWADPKTLRCLGKKQRLVLQPTKLKAGSPRRQTGRLVTI